MYIPTRPSADHRTPRRHRPGLPTALCVATVLFTACASSVPAPTQQMAASQAAVTSAATAGAAELAPAELSTARDKLARATAAVTEEHHDYANRLAREAQADANLAEMKTRNTKAQKAASELGEGNRVLREELQRANK